MTTFTFECDAVLISIAIIIALRDHVYRLLLAIKITTYIGYHILTFRYPDVDCQGWSAFVHGRRSHFRPCHTPTPTPTMRVQKGLPRTILPAPSMSPRALPRVFPPSEALKKPKYNERELAVETYSQLQPPDASALVAFAHRIGIASIFSAEDDIPSLVRQALTHPSFAPFHQSHYPNEVPPPTNASLAAMGNSLLGLFATEHVHASYPHLPTRVLKVTVSAYVGPKTCQAIAKEIGAAPLLRWARTVRVYSIFYAHLQCS